MKKRTQEERDAINDDALDRAQTNRSLANYPAIYQGFEAKGIAEADIEPRENIFTFAAWKALGRTVKRGEHGVRIPTFIRISKEEINKETGEIELKHKTR